MRIGTYWVGQVPEKPLYIKVADQHGNAVHLEDYTNIELKMLGSDNEEIDTSGGLLVADRSFTGVVRYEWPNETLFTKPGDYVIQLKLESDTARDFTSVGTFIVKKMGRRKM